MTGGNFQTYGEDYKETYARVVSFSLVRMLLYLLLCLKMVVAQLYVKTAFLNGKLTKRAWVMSLRVIAGRKSLCYRLSKAMYGLKKAHLACNTELCGALLGMGFEELPSAPCVFRRRCQSGYTFILVYVDDLLVLALTLVERDSFVEELKGLCKLRMTKEVYLFLRFQLEWNLNAQGRPVSFMLSQLLYTESILRRFGTQFQNRHVPQWWSRSSLVW